MMMMKYFTIHKFWLYSRSVLAFCFTKVILVIPILKRICIFYIRSIYVFIQDIYLQVCDLEAGTCVHVYLFVNELKVYQRSHIPVIFMASYARLICLCISPCLNSLWELYTHLHLNSVWN